jgi:signal transduction histidine kinase
MLTGILGNASLALMEVEKDTTVFESLKAIEGIAFRASDLTYKMLSFSGKSRFHIQPLDLNRTIENLVQIFKSTISEEIIIKIDTIPDLPEIQADVGQIRHLVMSLLANATEAIGNLNGIVKINTGLLELDREFLSRTVVDDNLPEGDYIYIEVMDNGCGIEEERLSKIFDPFYSTKFTGRGLGLSSVLGIVRGHKGAIKVESQLGLGSTFTVFLPYLDKKKAGI